MCSMVCVKWRLPEMVILRGTPKRSIVIPPVAANLINHGLTIHLRLHQLEGLVRV